MTFLDGIHFFLEGIDFSRKCGSGNAQIWSVGENSYAENSRAVNISKTFMSAYLFMVSLILTVAG